MNIALFRRVLVGVDGSDGSSRALAWTALLARETQSEIIAAHVLTFNAEFARDLSFDTMRTWRQDLHEHLETDWIKPLDGIACETVLVEADSPASGLLDLAATRGADLLVVGAKGHGNLAGRVLGGVSYRVAHHAAQPVLIVPADWHAPSTATSDRATRES